MGNIAFSGTKINPLKANSEQVSSEPAPVAPDKRTKQLKLELEALKKELLNKGFFRASI